MSGECKKCSEHCLDCICNKNKEYIGFKFPMGSFICWDEKDVYCGKMNPLTKEILECYKIGKDGLIEVH